MRKLVVLIIIIIGGILFYFLYGILSFDFEYNPELLQKYKFEKHVNIEVYYIPSNPTSHDFIQVRIKDLLSKQDTIINYEEYNYIIRSKLDGPILSFVLQDTSLYRAIRIDSFIINLNDYFELEND